jgi:hypothetical protein
MRRAPITVDVQVAGLGRAARPDLDLPKTARQLSPPSQRPREPVEKPE